MSKRKTAFTLKQDLEVVDKMLLSRNVAEVLGVKTEAAKRFVRLTLANTLLMERKQLDYGPENIAEYGTFGVIVRMSDKQKRLKTLFNKGKRRRSTNESIEDTFRDISNYAIIALMLENGMWPNE